MAKLKDTVGNNGLLTDGNWILSENLDNAGTVGVIQMKHIGIGEFLDKKFSFISNDTFNQLKCTEVKQNDILISRMAEPIARACIVPKLSFKTVTAVDVSILRVDENIADIKYVQFLCNSDLVRRQAEGVGRGTTRQRITRKELELIEIPFPKIEEQKRIAAILDKADRLRRQRRFAQTLSDSFLQSVFIKMFGDPLSNPMNWESNRLGKHTSLVSSGSTPLGGETVYQRKGIRFIRSQNVLMNEFDFSDIAFIDEKTYQSMKRTQVKRNDVLINITGASIGRVACYKEDVIANVNQHVCIIRLAVKNLLPDFLAWELSMPFYQKTVISSQSGATRQAFNFDQIKNFTIINPPLPLQEKFAAIVQKFGRVRRQQREATRQAEHLFQTLLHRAFRGEV